MLVDLTDDESVEVLLANVTPTKELATMAGITTSAVRTDLFIYLKIISKYVTPSGVHTYSNRMLVRDR